MRFLDRCQASLLNPLQTRCNLKVIRYQRFQFDWGRNFLFLMKFLVTARHRTNINSFISVDDV